MIIAREEQELRVLPPRHRCVMARLILELLTELYEAAPSIRTKVQQTWTQL